MFFPIQKMKEPLLRVPFTEPGPKSIIGLLFLKVEALKGMTREQQKSSVVSPS